MAPPEGSGGEVLGYRQKQDGKTVGLLHQPSEGPWGLWTCPTSLREVEPGVNLLLTDFVADDGVPFEFPDGKDGDAATEDDAVPALSEDEVTAARATPAPVRPS